MPRRTKQPEPRQANLSWQEMEDSIPKIDRRIAELDEFDVESVNDRGDPKIGTLAKKLDALLISIFRVDTVEYDRYRYSVTNLDTAPIVLGRGIPMHEVREGLHRGIARAKSHLEAIK